VKPARFRGRQEVIATPRINRLLNESVAQPFLAVHVVPSGVESVRYKTVQRTTRSALEFSRNLIKTRMPQSFAGINIAEAGEFDLIG